VILWRIRQGANNSPSSVGDANHWHLGGCTNGLQGVPRSTLLDDVPEKFLTFQCRLRVPQENHISEGMMKVIIILIATFFDLPCSSGEVDELFPLGHPLATLLKATAFSIPSQQVPKLVFTGTNSFVSQPSHLRVQNARELDQVLSASFHHKSHWHMSLLYFCLLTHDIVFLFDGDNINNSGIHLVHWLYHRDELILGYTIRYFQTDADIVKTSSYAILLVDKRAPSIVFFEDRQPNLYAPAFWAYRATIDNPIAKKP
jgi:hypothetical protein